MNTMYTAEVSDILLNFFITVSNATPSDVQVATSGFCGEPFHETYIYFGQCYKSSTILKNTTPLSCKLFEGGFFVFFFFLPRQVAKIITILQSYQS